MTLHTPLTCNDEGEIIDARDWRIGETWVSSDLANREEAAMTACELAWRANMHDRLVDAITECAIFASHLPARTKEDVAQLTRELFSYDIAKALFRYLAGGAA